MDTKKDMYIKWVWFIVNLVVVTGWDASQFWNDRYSTEPGFISYDTGI